MKKTLLVALALVPLAGCAGLLNSKSVNQAALDKTLVDGVACGVQVEALVQAAKAQVPACVTAAQEAKSLVGQKK